MLGTQQPSGRNKLTRLLGTLSTAFSRTLFLSPTDFDPEIWAAALHEDETSHPRSPWPDKAEAPVALKRGM